LFLFSINLERDGSKQKNILSIKGFKYYEIFFLKLVVLILMQAATIPGTSQRISDSLLVYLETADRQNPYIKQKFNEYRAALQRSRRQALCLIGTYLGFLIKPMEW
jgi:hypothetical protein